MLVAKRWCDTMLLSWPRGWWKCRNSELNTPIYEKGDNKRPLERNGLFLTIASYCFITYRMVQSYPWLACGLFGPSLAGCWFAKGFSTLWIVIIVHRFAMKYFKGDDFFHVCCSNKPETSCNPYPEAWNTCYHFFFPCQRFSAFTVYVTFSQQKLWSFCSPVFPCVEKLHGVISILQLLMHLFLKAPMPGICINERAKCNGTEMPLMNPLGSSFSIFLWI